jgi:hypothetical protein
MRSCPQPLDWLDWIETGRPHDERAEHLPVCAACPQRVSLLEPVRDLQLGPPPAAPVYEPYLRAYQRAAPRKADVWFSAPAFSYNATCGYEDLDRLMFVVLDESICEAGRRWLDVVPLWPDTDLAADSDLVLQADHSSLQMPLRAQPHRQLMMAYEQLDQKVGEVFDQAMSMLIEAVAGRLDPELAGPPYEGAADWRLQLDDWGAALVEQLRQPYLQALADASEAVEEAASQGRLAEVVRLMPRRQTRAEGQRMAWAARSVNLHEQLQLADDAGTVEAWVMVDLANDLLLITMEKLESELAERLELLIEFKDGSSASAVFPALERKVALPASGHTDEQIYRGLLRPHC